MAIVKASNRYRVITSADHGNWLEIGPASTSMFVGTFVIQFNPDVFWSGAIVVGARVVTAENAPDMPFLPIPYRRVTVNNVASDRAFVADQITGATKIEVPSSQDSIGFLVSCLGGNMTYACWDLQGPSAG